MKLLITVHNSMFDAALPLLRRLKEKCELHCLLEFDMTEDNIFGITNEDFEGKFSVKGENVLKNHKFASFLPIANTTLIKYYPPRSIAKHIQTQFFENKSISAIRPDIIYFYNVPLQSSLYILLSKTKWATAVHDPIPHSDERHLLVRSIISWPIYYKCKHYFLFSECFVEDFKKYRKLKNTTIHITKLGPYEMLNPQFQFKNYEGYDLKLLFFGKIKKYKGLRYLLQAYKQLSEDEMNNNISLTIAGSGEIEQDIVDFSKDPKIKVLNRFIQNDELAKLINECDVVVCPYIDATQSGVIMSAYSFCKPVIATNVGGLAEMVLDGVTGKIIEPRNVEQLIKCIKEISLNRSKLHLMSQNIYKKYYEGKESWDFIADNLLNSLRLIYNSNE